MSIFTSALALFTGPYGLLLKWGVIAALVASFYAFAWYRGDMHGTQKLLDYQAKEVTEALRVIKGRDRVTEAVVTRYVKVKGDTKVITETVTKEVLSYAEANPGSCLDVRWGLLHDSAALNTVPDPGLKPDGTGGTPAAAAALETVAGNYAACYRTADRLTALQAWVKEQQAVR